MKVVIYVRVSTAEQALEGYSIAAQIAILKEYAKLNDFVILKIYQDAGISGKNIKDRPSLLELIQDAKEGKFEAVLVWKLSRLSRSLLDLLSIVDVFNQNKISFHSYSEKFDTSTPIGKMLLQLLGSIAEFERNTIVENVKLGLGERFKQGYSKGTIPFGYKYENKKAVVDSEQADMVKHVFDYYLKAEDNNCLNIIADHLNSSGYRTRVDGLWSRHSIKEMLMNKFYAGYVRTGVKSHGRKKVNYAETKGEHEPIISIEKYEKVQGKINGNKLKSYIKNQDNDSFLTGLMVCPICGSKLYAINTHSRYISKSGLVKTYDVKGYRCISGTKGKIFCSGFTITAKKVEPQTLKMLNDFVSEGFEKAKKLAESQIVAADKNNLTYIENCIKDTIRIRDKYFKIFESEDVDINLFSGKLNDILKKLEDLESERCREIKRLEDISGMGADFSFDNIGNFTETFQYLSNEQKKELIRVFIKTIALSKVRTIDHIELVNGIKLYNHK